MKTKLAQYLDVQADSDNDSGGSTPRIGGSLDAMIRQKVLGMTDSDLEVFVGRMMANVQLNSLFEASLKSVKAVHAEIAVIPASTADGDISMMGSDSVTEQEGVKRAKTATGFHGRKWRELARFIPLRLTGDERRLLAILDRTLKVSEYTDNVDIYTSRRDRLDTVQQEITKIESILSGQFVAMKMSKNTDSLTQSWFKETFEVGRRYKAMNPDRLRETYVKLMYMLQDSRAVGDYCEWSQEGMKTVATALDQLGIEKVEFLGDALLDDFVHNNNKKSLDSLVDKFLMPPKSREQLELVINSVKDYYLLVNSFLDPINELLEYLKRFFDPKLDKQPGIDPRLTSLAIQSGVNGSRLSHSHSRQFMYVSQSLMLWREVLMYFMPIWFKAEEDLLGGNYRLADTGQGLNRVQSAPNCSRLMHQILEKVQRDLGGNWIGSSVVHMGDHTVPNALMFLDKYCQIPRILGPVAHTLKQLQKEYDSNLPLSVKDYIDSTFGGVENAQRAILVDFFRHAFDGSGADNAYDAGSCIDGRLTSSWNWCSTIERKAYFPLFLLTNFIGFDGQHGW